ncbi:UvrD-helicase domain-containing protein [Amphibacillus jilinensis]|uniref:UvrD-helicase domain-containing protein n=1 Tax=Amphibacillus jilinensis TaxID=1216008 RepID=UPI0002D68723|nr:ATP-dependent helicase [Amphibacillus jilinensis]
MVPTEEQQKIIDYNSNTVVIAQPGSGKTFTLVNKITNILAESPIYKGVIAISFTGKASRELEKRCMNGGIDKKGTFFGTMDKFYISEIILPFGRHLFSKPKKELEIIDKDHPLFKKYIEYGGADDLKSWFNKNMKTLKWLYSEGYVILESVSELAMEVLLNSMACKRYLSARYSHIVIDEYQDSGRDQHKLFIELNNLGLIGIAVGDINQSIFGFADKSSEYLIELAQNKRFKPFHITKNHRCHQSIINYSMKLISREFNDIIQTNESRMYRKKIIGNEIDIARWLDNAIPKTISMFDVDDFNKVGILVRGNRTGSLINEELTLNHKFFSGTPFDNDSSLWGNLFDNVLNFIFNKRSTKYEFIEQYLNIELQFGKAKRLIKLLRDVEDLNDYKEPLHLIDKFIEISSLIYPNAVNTNSVNILQKILADNDLLEKFKPANTNQVQIMTLHKSKGLEFDIVFHLDLYKYIMPSSYNGEYSSPIQDLNLHYVGITRAKKVCVLCTSTKRHNRNGEISGVESEFLQIPRLITLRNNFIF